MKIFKLLNLNIKILILLWVLLIVFSFNINDYKYQECFKIESKIIEDSNYTDNKVNQDIRNYVLICEKNHISNVSQEEYYSLKVGQDICYDRYKFQLLYVILFFSTTFFTMYVIVYSIFRN